VPASQRREVNGKGVEGVGVDDERGRAFGDNLRDRGLRAFVASKPGT
jgi:hypothetical protein